MKPKITERTNAGGSISYRVDAGIIDGKRYRRFFSTKKEAQEHADQLKKDRGRYGELAFALTGQQRIQAVQAFERLSDCNVTLTAVIDFYLRHNKPKGGQKSVADVVIDFLRTREQAGSKPRYLKALKCAFGKFTAIFGQRNIHEITRKEIEEWLETREFGGKIKRKYDPQTKRNYLRDLGMLFRFATSEGYVAENAVERIVKPKIHDSSKNISRDASGIQ